MDLLSQISRTALQEAEIIGQVDLKFILTKVPLGNLDRTHGLPRSECDQKPLLVLIDQHAADERCRVESLMKSYFSQESGFGPWNVQTEGLEKPLVFELPSKDGHLLQKHQKHFEYWGIVFKLAFSNEANREGKQRRNVKVEVQALPPSILERCRLEPRLLVDLLRKEVWKLYDEPSLAVNPEKNRLEELGGLDWVRMFHGCPQGILDLINSRSCRSKSCTAVPAVSRA
jgi:DNA mismatch repair protein MLH3